MAMEGINWDEVNVQASDIMKYFAELITNIGKLSQSFADELSIYWASGNAVTFEGVWNQKLNEIESLIESSEEEAKSCLRRAGEIYAGTFNVDNRIYVQSVSGIHISILGNKFKEIVNGVTGMNKASTDSCVSNYNNSIKKLIEDFTTNISSIHISIFDVAQSQSEAFSDCLTRMKNAIYRIIDEMLQYVEAEKEKEQDNLNLAKTQTTSTFNQ